jgi:hypothetical protein
VPKVVRACLVLDHPLLPPLSSTVGSTFSTSSQNGRRMTYPLESAYLSPGQSSIDGPK